MSNQVYVIGLNMDNMTPEEIARSAAERIIEITDELYQSRQEKENKNRGINDGN